MTDDIVVRDLHYAYPHAGSGGEVVPVLRGVDLQIASGEYVVLLGRVGAGKTTLCMALNGLVPQATGGRFRGDVTALGLNTKQHPVADLARHVGLVFQDPETQLTQMRVEDEIAFGPENLGLPSVEIAERVAWALDMVGLSACRARSPLLLSGGQKQRVAIAAMLAMQPSLLVLDEPTASLDPIGKVAVFSVMADLARERRIGIFMATQELEWVARFADRVLVLHEGRIALNGRPEEVFRHATELREWGIGVPQMVELADRLVSRTGRSFDFQTVAGAYRQLRQDAARGRAPGASDSTAKSASRTVSHVSYPSDTQVMHHQDEQFGQMAVPQADTPAIHIENLSYAYGDGTTALRGVDLELPAGDFVVLLGPNGSGKTTLAKHLNGLLRPRTGRVLVGGRDTRSTSVAELARQVGYLFQNPDHQIFAATVMEEVAFGPRSQGLTEEACKRRVAEVLDLFGLVSCAELPPASLGFAQRRHVALAAVLAARPRVLILDEPTGGVDASGREEIMAAVAGFNAAGGTVVLITHDMAVVAECARRAVVLLDGRVRYDGSVPNLFGRRDLVAQAGLSLPPVVRLAKRLARHGLAEGALTPAELVDAWAGPERMPADVPLRQGMRPVKTNQDAAVI